MPLTFVNASDFPAVSNCSDSPTVGGNNRPESYYRPGMVRNSIAVYKNPASSDSIVQTTKPAKMKQLYMTVAAVLLLFPNFGLTQERFYEVLLPIRANDIVDSPDGLLDMGTAFTFIDKICGQIPEGSPPYVTASGAYN